MAGRILWAWLLTIPASSAVAALMWWVLRLVAAGPRGLTSQALVVAGDSRLEEVTR